MSKENELFNKMIKHYLKSVAQNVSPSEKKEEEALYNITKHQLWSLQEDKNVKLN